MDVIVAQVRTLAEGADEAGRNDILNTLRDLQFDLEKPMDTFLNLYNSVHTSFLPKYSCHVFLCLQLSPSNGIRS